MPSESLILKTISIIFLLFTIVFAVPFYLWAIDGPYSLDYKLFYDSAQSHQQSITHTIEKRLEDTLGISQFDVRDFEQILLLLFLPTLVLFSNFRDYVFSRLRGVARNFSHTFYKSILFIAVAGAIGWLPSVVLGKFGCSGEYCSSTTFSILTFCVVTAIFALLSAVLSRRYGIAFFGFCFFAILALLSFSLLKVSTCNFGKNYSCLGVKAAYSNDLSICNRINAPYERKNSCYLLVSSKLGNIEACRSMSLDYYGAVGHQYMCLANVAVFTKNMDACDELAVDKARGNYILGWYPKDAIQHCKEDAQRAINYGYRSYSDLRGDEK